MRKKHYVAILLCLALLALGLLGEVWSAPLNETEPNDTPAQANPILPGPSNRVSGAITPLGDDDYFSFTASAGQVVFVSIETDPATEPDTILTLLATNGTTVIEFDDDDGPVILSSGIAGAVLPSPGGTYYLLVQGYDDDYVVDAYTLYLTVKPPAVVGESEPNNSAATANPSTGLNSGTIDPAGDVDYYSFYGAAGSDVSIGVDDAPGAIFLFEQIKDSDASGVAEPDGGLDTVIELYDIDGVTLLDLQDTNYGGPDEPEHLNYLGLPHTGTYYAAVYDAEGDGDPTFEYNISIDPLQQEPTPPPPFVPEASTIALLGSGLAGLAGYASLRLRVRRKRED